MERTPTYPVPERVIARLLSKTEQGPGDCLLSLYSLGSHGYAQIGWREPGYRTNVTLAHRAIWQHHNGPIPPGMTVDHTCRIRRCIRLDHLRLLPNKQNAREIDPYGHPPTPTDRLCRRGHALMAYASGATACRECSNLRERRKEQKRRGLPQEPL